MNEEKLEKTMFHDFAYKVENIVDELLIVSLSVGAIAVSVYTLFFSSVEVDFIQFGNIIDSWIIMLGLMIIGRELWLINRKFSAYLNHLKGEQ